MNLAWILSAATEQSRYDMLFNSAERTFGPVLTAFSNLIEGWYRRQHRFVRARVSVCAHSIASERLQFSHGHVMPQVVHEAGARGLVESVRSRILQRVTTSKGATPKPTAARETLHPNARLLPGMIGRIDEHAVRLYEVAAEQGSAFAALRAGDAAFYGGIGAQHLLHCRLKHMLRTLKCSARRTTHRGRRKACNEEIDAVNATCCAVLCSGCGN